MGERSPAEEPPVDMALVARDDLLLDVLSRSERPGADDEVAAMLAAWRADLDAEPYPRLDPHPHLEPAAKPWRLWRPLLLAAAALVALAGTLTVAASATGRGSPLCLVTTTACEDLPDSQLALQAEEAIAKASTALDNSQVDEARQLLAQADALADRIHDEAIRLPLKDKIDALSTQIDLAARPSAPPTTIPAPSASPGTGQPTGATPKPTTTSGGILPLPVPTVPVPLPTIPLPLPTLPLPTLPVPLPTLPLPLP